MKAHCNISGKLHGKVHFEQKNKNDLLHIYGRVCGFKESELGLKGFHVHEGNKMKGYCCGQGLAAHFNPFNTTHGDITDDPFNNDDGIKTRHAGDLGNILVDTYCENCDSWCSIIDIEDDVLSIYPRDITNIVNRGLVIHGQEDDLGLGGDKESLITGNAGKRVGFGVIKYDK